MTRFGVSVLNVVATMETPMSHHGAARPDVKDSAVLRPARRARRIAGKNEIAIENTTIVQSSVVGCTLRRLGFQSRDLERREQNRALGPSAERDRPTAAVLHPRTPRRVLPRCLGWQLERTGDIEPKRLLAVTRIAEDHDATV